MSDLTVTPTSSPESAPQISVSIVSYNTRDLLRACLTSLLTTGAIQEVIVADNASSDGSAEMVEREFPGVRLIHTGSNLGFGRAHNRALEAAQGLFFLILNSDAEMTRDALETLRRALQERPELAAVGPQLVWPDGSPQPSHGRDPRWTGVLPEQLFLDKIMARLSARIAVPTLIHKATPDKVQEVAVVQQLNGACLLVRREAWQSVGGFDPAFFMYVEDVDLCRRLRDAGWELGFVPGARVGHLLGGSSARDAMTRARMVAAYNHSRVIYFSRRDGLVVGRLVRAFTLLGALLRLGIWSTRSLLSARMRGEARDKVRLFRRVLRDTRAVVPRLVPPPVTPLSAPPRETKGDDRQNLRNPARKL